MNENDERNEAQRLTRERLESECEIEFLRGSGPGGQHRNTRDTGVRLTHLPSGIVVMATERRSQPQNLETAFLRLEAALARRNHVPKPRRKSRPTFASVLRRLEGKRLRAAHKSARKKPGAED